MSFLSFVLVHCARPTGAAPVRLSCSLLNASCLQICILLSRPGVLTVLVYSPYFPIQINGDNFALAAVVRVLPKWPFVVPVKFTLDIIWPILHLTPVRAHRTRSSPVCFSCVTGQDRSWVADWGSYIWLVFSGAISLNNIVNHLDD